MLNIEKCEQLEKILSNMVDQAKLPGYNMAIITPDQEYRDYYGYAQTVGETVMANPNTKYDLASCSKLVSTATCILKLMEEGLIQLDTRISEYLDIVEKEITVKDCLTHTTGFDDADIADYKSYSDEYFIEALKSMKSHEDLKGNVHYSDTNFIYLGWLIAKIKGSLDGYAKLAIFDPLSMINTGYNPVDKENCAATEVTAARGIIKGVVHDGKTYRLNGVGGSAGVFSNIDDMVAFVRMIMDENNSFLNEESRKLLKTVLADTPTGRRSVGWCISDPTMPGMGSRYSEHTLYHTGFCGCSIFIDLDRQIALIVLCNRVHPDRNNKTLFDARVLLHNQIYDCLPEK